MADGLEPIAISALRHCAVVSFGHTGFSAPLMHRSADDGIALVTLDGNGRFKARLEGAVSGNVLLRRGGASIPLVGFLLLNRIPLQPHPRGEGPPE